MTVWLIIAAAFLGILLEERARKGARCGAGAADFQAGRKRPPGLPLPTPAGSGSQKSIDAKDSPRRS